MSLLPAPVRFHEMLFKIFRRYDVVVLATIAVCVNDTVWPFLPSQMTENSLDSILFPVFVL